MLKRSFNGSVGPKFDYAPLPEKFAPPETIATKGKVTLLLEEPFTQSSGRLQKGAQVKTGQKLRADDNPSNYVISSVTGTITNLTAFTGDYGRQFTAIEIDVAAQEAFDNAFEAAADTPTLETLIQYLNNLPGNPAFERFTDTSKPIDTIVVLGCEQDLLVATTRHTIETRMADIKNGIGILKAATGIEKILVAVPDDLIQGYGHIGAEVIAVGRKYPEGMIPFVAYKILGRIIPAGQTPENLGLGFIRAEAVAALGQAFDERRIPVSKTLTFIDKDGNRKIVAARMGTACRDIMDQHRAFINDRDRLIIGGPMTGSAVFSEDYPVGPETDAIMLQDRYDIPHISDYPCINCGECIRVCPTRVPVNMLVRFLEARQYAEAADLYDLYACIECGLCSFVCVAKIPIFQYIKLAKYELSLEMAETADTTEAANE